MKVNRIESSLSTVSRGSSLPPLKARTCNSTNVTRTAMALLLLTLLTLIAAGPRQAFTAQGRKAKQPEGKPYREGKKAIRKGDYEKAIHIYLGQLEQSSLDIHAHLGASVAYMKSLNYLSCYNHALEAIKLDQKNAHAYALAGTALLRSGYVENAVAHLLEAFRLDPKEPLAWGAAAEIDYYEGRPKEAREKAYRASVLDPEEPDYFVTYARASSRLELFAEAADAYERYLGVSPQSDGERRARIEGLIQFYRKLDGVEVHQLSGLKTVEVPFKLGSDRRPYVSVKINGKPATFVVDTGSGFTVISKESAKRFDVAKLASGGTSQGVGGNGKFDIVYGLIKSIQIGDVRIKSVPCFIRPFFGNKERSAGEYADGFIGLSILSHFLTELDYKHTTMRLDRDFERSTQLVASPEMTVIPFRTTQNGLISIETELDNSHRINAILDSGASSTVVSTAAVERLKMHDSIIKGQTARVVGAAGISENVELLFIRNCRVAGLQHKNMRALVLDFNAINETAGFEQGGILGGDFLRNFRVTIDFNRTQVAFTPYVSGSPKQ